jgi:hypothetical protein
MTIEELDEQKRAFFNYIRSLPFVKNIIKLDFEEDIYQVDLGDFGFIDTVLDIPPMCKHAIETFTKYYQENIKSACQRHIDYYKGILKQFDKKEL